LSIFGSKANVLTRGNAKVTFQGKEIGFSKIGEGYSLRMYFAKGLQG
jgi:hypothetical protein